MKKKNSTSPPKFDFLRYLRNQTTGLKKKSLKIWKQAKAFLALKYWPIYGLSFALGFWLWGPAHGLHTLKNWNFNQSQQQQKQSLTTEALQKQLTELKQALKTAQAEKETPPFDPTIFSRPALGEVIRGFDWTETGKSWRLHTGVDIKLPPDSNIIAAAAGGVLEVKEIAPGDYSVTIEHGDNWKSVYANLSKALVIEGQQVIKGVILGISGKSGCDPQIPSFHFAIYHNQQPLDPGKIIPGL